MCGMCEGHKSVLFASRLIWSCSVSSCLIEQRLISQFDQTVKTNRTRHGVHVSSSNARGFLWQSCIAFLIECCCPQPFYYRCPKRDLRLAWQLQIKPFLWLTPGFQILFSPRKWLKLLTLLVSVALTDAVKATDTNWATTLIVRHISVLCRSSTAVGHVIILQWILASCLMVM